MRSGLLRRSCFARGGGVFGRPGLEESPSKSGAGAADYGKSSVKTACYNAISRALRTGTAAALEMCGRALLFFAKLSKWATRRQKSASEAIFRE